MILCDDCSSCFSPCLTVPHTKTYKKYQLGGSDIYDLYLEFCPTTRRNIPWLSLCFSMAAAAAPPSASHPWRRGWTALHQAAGGGHAAVVEQLISAGATVDAASERGRGPGRVFESFWEWLWRGDGRGSYTGSWFRAVLWESLGCWVVLGLKRSLCHLSLELGLASWNSRKRNDRTWRGKQHDWKPEASMLSQNVQWLEVSCDLDLDPSLTSNWNKLKRLQELGTTRCLKSILFTVQAFSC